ncbi:MAG: hypothetical protein KatS3mg131_2662 [Candidatus Tectimicrobiota bacterium]|nr:MAG: hypothetical protein KatS3mg131_2662 [Candidatus Tectomicrobia bacterium]
MAEGADGALPDRWLVDDRLCPEQLLEQARLHRHLQGAIECLPEAFREVIVLRYFEGLSYAEIAQVLGCPAGTVMSRLSRAKAALRRQLRHLTEQEEAPVRRPEQHEG